MGSQHFAHEVFFVMDCENVVNADNKRLSAEMGHPQMVNELVEL